jgi:hypothetical protein
MIKDMTFNLDLSTVDAQLVESFVLDLQGVVAQQDSPNFLAYGAKDS